MGYACPVCGTPQRDGEHLANHLAFTAMLDGGDHEAWLDEHAPDWEEAGPADLAPRVTERAPEAEYEEVFEDTVARRAHGHGPDDRGGALFEDESGHGPGRTPFDVNTARDRGGAQLDEEAKQILSEAQEMTQELLTADDDDATEDRGGDRTDESDGDDQSTDAEGNES